MSSPGRVLWGPDHVSVMALTVAAAALIAGRRRLRPELDRRGRLGVASLLLGNELVGWGWAAAHGSVRIPLQFCDLAMFLTVWALGSLRPRVCELAYFWGLAGSVQAILTPDLQRGFPDYWWVKFFLGHCGVVLSVTYLALTNRIAATPQSVWRVFGLTNIYAVAAGIVNACWHTNYGYLAHKPAQPSLLDYFGPWPYYILAMEAAALASFFLYYAPLAMARRRRSA